MSEYQIPEDLRVVGDLFPHRYRPARDDEGFSLGHLLPCDSGPWISTVHAFSVAKTLIERIAKQDAEIERLKRELSAMTEDRNLWKDDHEGDCPYVAENTSLKAQVERLSAPVILTDDELLDLNEKYGYFQFGDAQGSKSRAFADDVARIIAARAGKETQ